MNLIIKRQATDDESESKKLSDM